MPRVQLGVSVRPTALGESVQIGVHFRAHGLSLGGASARVKQLAECTRQYIERVELSTRVADDARAAQAQAVDGEQGRLNRIIASLDFGEATDGQ